jgi:hypothetical protein
MAAKMRKKRKRELFFLRLLRLFAAIVPIEACRADPSDKAAWATAEVSPHHVFDAKSQKIKVA